jgi:hypothetical protein
MGLPIKRRTFCQARINVNKIGAYFSYFGNPLLCKKRFTK